MAKQNVETYAKVLLKDSDNTDINLLPKTTFKQVVEEQGGEPKEGGKNLEEYLIGQDQKINEKQDKLPAAEKGKYLHVNAETGSLEWSAVAGDVTREYVDEQDKAILAESKAYTDKRVVVNGTGTATIVLDTIKVGDTLYKNPTSKDEIGLFVYDGKLFIAFDE